MADTGVYRLAHRAPARGYGYGEFDDSRFDHHGVLSGSGHVPEPEMESWPVLLVALAMLAAPPLLLAWLARKLYRRYRRR